MSSAVRSVYTWINPKILKKCDNLNTKFTISWSRSDNNSQEWHSCQFQQRNPLGPLHILSFSFFIWSKAQKRTTYAHSFLTFFYVTWCIVHAVCIDIFLQIGFMLVDQFRYSTHNFKENFNCAWNTKICWIWLLKAGLSEEKLSFMPCLWTLSNVLF